MKHTEIKLAETTINSKKVYSGSLIHAFKDKVRLPDGRQSVREWIDHPGASAVLPVFGNGEVQLIRQFRYPLKQTFLEVPAGKIDEGEEPLVTAKRELEEESGIRAKSWAPLGKFHPCIGYTNEVIYLYVAWDLEVAESKTDQDEFVAQVKMPFANAVEKVLRGSISDGKTITTIFRAANWWKKNKPFPVSNL